VVLRVDVGIDAPSRRAAAFARGDRGEQLEFASDSTLMQRMPWSTAAASSSALLPMPENMILSGAMPARRARVNSPPEHVGAGAELASVAITAWLEFAFMA